MAERKHAATDGLGWLLLFCGLGVALCVLSHDPAAGGSSAPNLLGAPGHWLATELHIALGSAVYALLIAWFVLVLMLLVRKSWLRWTRRLAGWLILLPTTAIAFDWLGHDWLPGPIFGSGGTLGASLHQLLGDQLPGLPGVLSFAGIAFLGVFLAADFAITGCLYALYGVCFALSFGLAMVSRAISAMCRIAFARRPVSAKPQAAKASPKFDVPIQHTGFDVPPEPIIEPEPEPAILPIIRLGMANLPEENFDNYELPPCRCWRTRSRSPSSSTIKSCATRRPSSSKRSRTST